MKVTLHSQNVSIEAEGKSHRDVFEQLASLQEVFGERACGCCGKTDLVFRVREVDDNKFYELCCTDWPDCGAKLAFGCHKKGDSLFPKRKDDAGKWDSKNKGWVKYVKPKTNGKAAKAAPEVAF